MTTTLTVVYGFRKDKTKAEAAKKNGREKEIERDRKKRISKERGQNHAIFVFSLST
jgi:hypothetical protein